ncbi:lipid transfer protein EARLI 1-like [Lycium barbarum]|uniref:lipid transfer protein EARLI 1-like n=1 Tax=Lycium barbarum TaxID=112863 RepID=UPI00293E96F7|nr:lipid transfer protein EARLI 1-like [Lycium barbarum]
MAKFSVSSISLVLTLNILFFTIVSSTYVPCPPPTNPKYHPTPTSSTPTPSALSPSPSTQSTPSTPSTPSNPTPATPSILSPLSTPKPSTTPTPSSKGKCPQDALKLRVCANLLNDLLHLIVHSSPAQTPCCSLIQGLADLDAAVCLCTAIKANVLGINLDVPLSINLLLNNCGKYVPENFQCA